MDYRTRLCWAFHQYSRDHFQVEDEMGLTCTTQRTLIVGTPPSALIQTPQAGTVFNVGEAVSLSGVVSDSEDSPVDLSVEWHSSIEGTLFSGFPLPLVK